jgi:hypothetical protein
VFAHLPSAGTPVERPRLDNPSFQSSYSADHQKEALMNVEQEIHALAAETLALSVIVANVCRHLSDDPRLHAAIEAAFNDASRFVEDQAVALSKTASPDHTVKAIKIVEDLRAAALGKEHKPKHGV